MAKTLTIVAQRPNSTNQEEGDTAIEAVIERLDNRLNKDEHLVARAARLQGLKTVLRAHKPRLDTDARIQIIGHGRPGALMLGGSWPDAEFFVTSDDVLCVDSDYEKYAMLKDEIPAQGRVLLLGCGVGVGAEPELRIADGPTLLFDLARMWGCDVAAPWDSVTAEDLDEHGIYADEVGGKSRVAIAHAKEIRVDGLRTELRVTLAEVGEFRRFTRIDGLPPNIVFKHVLGLPIIGVPDVCRLRMSRPLRRRLNARVAPRLQDMSELVEHEVDASLLLAAAELVIDVSLDGEEGEAEIIGSGRLMRARTETGTRYFEFKSTPAERQRMLRSIRAIVAVFEP